MGVLKFDGTDDELIWSTLASALANVSDGAWTVAAVVRRNSTGASADSISTLLSASGASSEASLTFASANTIIADISGVADPTSPTVFTNTTAPYMVALSKGAGTATLRLAWKVGAGGSWTHENLTTTLVDQIASTSIRVGGWSPFNGWIGVVAWWEGAMSDANKEALDNNWRTSALWSSAHGQPAFLAQCNVAGASVVDLASNASALAVVGTTLDAAETLEGWTFDGITADTEDVLIDVGIELGAVAYRGSGFLHGINDATGSPPTTSPYYGPLNGRLYRNSNTSSGGNHCTVDSTYPLVFPGATVELVMSDAWSNNATFKTEAAAGNYTNVDPIMSSQVTKYRDKGGGAWSISHDIHNEPNHGTPWSGTQAQFFTYWAHAYTLIRTDRPGAVIVGPSIATVFPSGHTWATEVIWLQDFLTFCNTNSCLPDRVSWHENGSSAATMENHIADVRSWMQINLGTILPIELNELMGDTAKWRPAEAATYFAGCERAAIFGACKSIWSPDTTGSMDGLLSTTPEPRSIWWTFRKYADMAGQMIHVNPLVATLDGVASYDGTAVRAVIGNNTASSTPYDVRLNNIPPALIKDTSVRVSVIAIADSGSTAVTSLPSPTITTVSVTGSDAVIPLTFGAWGAYAITVENPGRRLILR